MSPQEQRFRLALIAHAAQVVDTNLRALPATCSGVRTAEARIARAIAEHAQDDLAAAITDNSDGYWESEPVGEMGVLDVGLPWPTAKGEAA